MHILVHTGSSYNPFTLYFCLKIENKQQQICFDVIREAMKESDVEIILQRAREKFPDAKPRIISDNAAFLQVSFDG